MSKPYLSKGSKPQEQEGVTLVVIAVVRLADARLSLSHSSE